MDEVLSMRLANPASQHSSGRRARLLLENARDSIAASVDAHLQSVNSDLVLFTSGGTEANNLAILGLPQKPGAIVVSAIEHPSVLAAAEHAKSLGRVVRLLPVDSSGVARMDLLEDWIADHRAHPNSPDHQIALVSLMIANNETGVLQPILPAAALCRSAGIPIHADGVQALGKGPLSFKTLGVDALTLSAHKIHGPVGIGALILRHPFKVTPQMWGGFQQFGMRPGSSRWL